MPCPQVAIIISVTKRASTEGTFRFSSSCYYLMLLVVIMVVAVVEVVLRLPARSWRESRQTSQCRQTRSMRTYGPETRSSARAGRN